jgi:hypothetical protein
MSKEEHKDAIEVSIVFHEGQRMMAVPKHPAPVQPETDSCGSGAGCLYKVAMIENLEEEVERLKAAQPAPVQDSTCSETLRAQGKAYPRTCKKCGKGPCIGAPKQPPEQPAPTVQEPVAYEYGDDVFWHDSPDINDYIRANGNALVYATPPAAQPAVPDAITDRSEHPEYIQGWNDCRAEMLRGMKP